MEYDLEVVFSTKDMDKVTEYMRRIFPEWERDDKELLMRTTYRVTTDRPFAEEDIRRMKDNLPEGIRSIDIKEVKV